MEENPEAKPPNSANVWGRGVLAGMGQGLIISFLLLFLDSVNPLKGQFSSDDVETGAFVIASLGFVVCKFEGKPGEINFSGKWGYLFGCTLVGLFFLFASPYAGFLCIVFGASITFGVWLKMVWLQSKISQKLK